MVAGGLALLASGTLLWTEVVKDRVIAKRWGTVVEGAFYRCGRLHPALAERQLRRYGIKLVVDLTETKPGDRYQAAEAAAVERLGIRMLHLPIPDGAAFTGQEADEAAKYAEALEAIAASIGAGQPAVVHCRAGVQRTGIAVAMYRLFIDRWTPEEAYAEMLRYRWNPVDDGVLLPYINRLLPDVARRLADKGVIGELPDPMPQFGVLGEETVLTQRREGRKETVTNLSPFAPFAPSRLRAFALSPSFPAYFTPSNASISDSTA